MLLATTARQTKKININSTQFLHVAKQVFKELSKALKASRVGKIKFEFHPNNIFNQTLKAEICNIHFNLQNPCKIVHVHSKYTKQKELNIFSQKIPQLFYSLYKIFRICSENAF